MLFVVRDAALCIQQVDPCCRGLRARAEGIVMSEQKLRGEEARSLAKGLLAGLIAGLAATAAKTLAERIFPPQPKHDPESPFPRRRVRLAETPDVARQGEAERGLPLGSRRGRRRYLWRGGRVLPRSHVQARGQLRPGAGGAQPRRRCCPRFAAPAPRAAQPESRTRPRASTAARSHPISSTASPPNWCAGWCAGGSSRGSQNPLRSSAWITQHCAAIVRATGRRCTRSTSSALSRSSVSAEGPCAASPRLPARSPCWPRQQGKLAGFCIAQLEDRTGYVVTLDVAPAWRRRGLARRLMAEIESRLHSAGAAEMHLHVFTGNAAAIRFYESIGYTPAGENFYAQNLHALSTASA